MTTDRHQLRVLYVINSLGPGGAERSLAELIQPLKERGIDISVACLEHVDEGVEDEVVERHDVRFVGPGLLGSLRSLRQIVGSERPDLIHTTIFEADVLGRLASIGRGVPVVTSIVNTSYLPLVADHPDVTRWKLRIVRAVDRITARRVNQSFHALTEAAAQGAVEALGISRDRVEVIPRGRSTDRLGEPTAERRRRVQQELGVEGRRVLLSVGRREHQKGQIHAIDAVGRLGIDNVVLLIAGRHGAASERLSRRADELGLGPKVRFLGHRDDVPDLMVASDVLVFPSLYEGLGGAAIEAMALGLPIISSDIPPLREAAQGVALFFPPGDAAALARAIEDLLTNADLAKRMSTEGRERFKENFTIDSVADAMAAYYRSQPPK